MNSGKRVKIQLVIIAIAVLVAAAGWGTAIWFHETRTPAISVDAKDAIELNPELADTGSAVLEALERRNSALASDFTDKPVSDDKLLALAWAATGKNRDGTGFVVPLAMHSEPYVSVYVATTAGIGKFEWQTNAFAEVGAGDARQSLVTQDFAKRAPALMILVIDKDKIPSGNMDWGYIAVGSMSENVYLLADDLNVQTRLVASIDESGIRDALELSAEQIPVAAIVMADK